MKTRMHTSIAHVLPKKGVVSRIAQREKIAVLPKKLHTPVHTSVLLAEVVAALNPQNGEVLLDTTLGQGGHAKALLAKAPGTKLIGLDADADAIALAQKNLAAFNARVAIVESNFADSDAVLKKLSTAVDKAVFDLGWNSGQLSGKGMSFLVDEPLDMSYGKVPASGFTASEILNEWNEETLANMLYGYGEEHYARRIASAVVARRALQPIHTTIEFVEIIRDAVPAAYRRPGSKIHFATRSFQALRMAVNDELGVIERGLAGVWKHLSPGGRIAVITFHSIEDRLVKRLFVALAKEDGKIITKKPLVPSRAEIIRNPRARSAKLRVIEKICKEH